MRIHAPHQLIGTSLMVVLFASCAGSAHKVAAEPTSASASDAAEYAAFDGWQYPAATLERVSPSGVVYTRIALIGHGTGCFDGAPLELTMVSGFPGPGTWMRIECFREDEELCARAEFALGDGSGRVAGAGCAREFGEPAVTLEPGVPPIDVLPMRVAVAFVEQQYDPRQAAGVQTCGEPSAAQESATYELTWTWIDANGEERPLLDAPEEIACGTGRRTTTPVPLNPGDWDTAEPPEVSLQLECARGDIGFCSLLHFRVDEMPADGTFSEQCAREAIAAPANIIELSQYPGLRGTVRAELMPVGGRVTL